MNSWSVKWLKEVAGAKPIWANVPAAASVSPSVKRGWGPAALMGLVTRSRVLALHSRQHLQLQTHSGRVEVGSKVPSKPTCRFPFPGRHPQKSKGRSSSLLGSPAFPKPWPSPSALVFTGILKSPLGTDIAGSVAARTGRKMEDAGRKRGEKSGTLQSSRAGTRSSSLAPLPAPRPALRVPPRAPPTSRVPPLSRAPGGAIPGLSAETPMRWRLRASTSAGEHQQRDQAAWHPTLPSCPWKPRGLRAGRSAWAKSETRGFRGPLGLRKILWFGSQ